MLLGNIRDLLIILTVCVSSRGALTPDKHVFPGLTFSPSITGKPYNEDPSVLKLRTPGNIPNMGPIQTHSADGWQLRYRSITSMIIPIQVAASVLEQFLTETLAKIARAQARGQASPNRNAFTLSSGSVFLAFKLADETKGLKWEAVEILINVLLDNVRRGWTMQFRSELLHPETGTVVYISLSMLQRFGPGPVKRRVGWIDEVGPSDAKRTS